MRLRKATIHPAPHAVKSAISLMPNGFSDLARHVHLCRFG
jgi:hypothetical protein